MNETEKAFWQALEHLRVNAEHRGLSSLYGDRVERAAQAMIDDLNKRQLLRINEGSADQ